MSSTCSGGRSEWSMAKREARLGSNFDVHSQGIQDWETGCKATKEDTVGFMERGHGRGNTVEGKVVVSRLGSTVRDTRGAQKEERGRVHAWGLRLSAAG